MEERQYLCIDQKSFYATVECVERGLDPMKAKLVVADPERSENTICLAVSPALKALGVKNRCRIKEVPPRLNAIVAEPRMQLYIDYAAEIHGVFLKYIAPFDIHTYSIDESFLDVTPYLKMYSMTAPELALKIMQDVKDTVGTICTCGVGTNLYLAKIALDIKAKHAKNYIGILDEESYCREMWDHKPITDFWRISDGTAARLKRYGITTLGGIAHCNEDLLYRAFGIDAEILYDHAWGREPVTIADIKGYKSKSKSLSNGQVLMRDYSFREALVIAKEMINQLSLKMVRMGVATESVSLYHVPGFQFLRYPCLLHHLGQHPLQAAVRCLVDLLQMGVQGFGENHPVPGNGLLLLKVLLPHPPVFSQRCFLLRGQAQVGNQVISVLLVSQFAHNLGSFQILSVFHIF